MRLMQSLNPPRDRPRLLGVRHAEGRLRVQVPVRRLPPRGQAAGDPVELIVRDDAAREE